MVVRKDLTTSCANSVPVLRAYFTKSRLMVFGFCPAGSTSKQLPFDQLEGCLIGFVEDGQKVHS